MRHLLACLLILNTFGLHAEQPLMVGAAASLQDVLPAVSAAYTKPQPKVEIKFNFVASSFLVMQLQKSAKMDLVVTADRASLGKIKALGVVQKQKDLLSNRLVLVTNPKAPQIKSLQDLKTAKFKRLATCEQHVPLGAYAKQVLTKSGLLDQLKDKFVFADNATGVERFVNSGAADYGFMYATDVKKAGKNVRVVEVLDASLHEPIVYPAALLSPSARGFYDFLSSPEAKKIFLSFGFSVLN